MKKITFLMGAALLSAAASAGDGTKPTATSASFESLDKNADQQISKTEAAADPVFYKSFASADANGDGYVDKPEFVARTQPKS